jgi:hypothetical protein
MQIVCETFKKEFCICKREVDFWTIKGCAEINSALYCEWSSVQGCQVVTNMTEIPVRYVADWESVEGLAVLILSEIWTRCYTLLDKYNWQCLGRLMNNAKKGIHFGLKGMSCFIEMFSIEGMQLAQCCHSPLECLHFSYFLPRVPLPLFCFILGLLIIIL